jgi:hypothetical protein
VEHPKQFHLDIGVADIDDAHSQVVASGASLLRVDHEAGGVSAHPAGHPFCLLKSGR